MSPLDYTVTSKFGRCFAPDYCSGDCPLRVSISASHADIVTITPHTTVLLPSGHGAISRLFHGVTVDSIDCKSFFARTTSSIKSNKFPGIFSSDLSVCLWAFVIPSLLDRHGMVFNRKTPTMRTVDTLLYTKEYQPGSH